MSIEQRRRWCIFTSGGDKNAICTWLKGATLRQWDLVTAYYGDNDDEFAKIHNVSCYAFRTKGSKFQNLKKLIAEAPRFFDQYSHIWVCDDDIQMSAAQIEEAFTITEMMDFWVAQPAFHPKGKVSQWVNCSAWPQWDYRIVNYVEVTMPIFRHDKFVEFLTAYEDGLIEWGVDRWYSNFFKANDFGRFAIIDRVRVVNPHDAQKGGREIDRLQSESRREAAWNESRDERGLTGYPHKVFSYCRLAPKRDLYDEARQLKKSGFSLRQIIFVLFAELRRANWRDAIGPFKMRLND